MGSSNHGKWNKLLADDSACSPAASEDSRGRIGVVIGGPHGSLPSQLPSEGGQICGRPGLRGSPRKAGGDMFAQSSSGCRGIVGGSTLVCG